MLQQRASLSDVLLFHMNTSWVFVMISPVQNDNTVHVMDTLFSERNLSIWHCIYFKIPELLPAPSCLLSKYARHRLVRTACLPQPSTPSWWNCPAFMRVTASGVTCQMNQNILTGQIERNDLFPNILKYLYIIFQCRCQSGVNTPGFVQVSTYELIRLFQQTPALHMTFVSLNNVSTESHRWI